MNLPQTKLQLPKSHKTINQLMGIDLRSLALFRIFLGVIVVVDLAIRWSVFEMFYTDQGVISVEQLRALSESTSWSFHFFYHENWYHLTLFALLGVSAVMMILGLFTRVALLVAFVLLASIQTRMPLVNNAGDGLLKLFIFWSIFLPLGRRWSIDRLIRKRRGKVNQKEQDQVVSISSGALMLQFCMMYFFTGLFKYNDGWFSGDALFYTLSMDAYARPFAEVMLGYPQLLKLATYGTLCLEILGPILLFVPWNATIRWRLLTTVLLLLLVGTALAGKFEISHPITLITMSLLLLGLVPLFWRRVILMLMFLSLHLGIEVCMTVGLFSFVSFTGWILFIPSGFWDYFGQIILKPTEQPTQNCPIHKNLLGFIADGICGVLLLYVIWWNLATVRWQQFGTTGVSLPLNLQPLGSGLRISQKWNMFGRPPKKDGWFVAYAVLKDGTDLNLLQPDQTLDKISDKPQSISNIHPNHRLRKFYRNLSKSYTNDEKKKKSIQEYRKLVSEYLCRKWNQAHPPEKQIELFILYYNTEFLQSHQELPDVSTDAFHRIEFD